jgi:hypothetical protein
LARLMVAAAAAFDATQRGRQWVAERQLHIPYPSRIIRMRTIT